MKKKLFYDHIVSINELVIVLNKLDLEEDEKTHLIEIAATSIHYAVLDVSLSNLSTENKKTFMLHINSNEHDKAWEFLKKNTKNIDKEIKKTAQKIIQDFKKDINNLI